MKGLIKELFDEFLAWSNWGWYVILVIANISILNYYSETALYLSVIISILVIISYFILFSLVNRFVRGKITNLYVIGTKKSGDNPDKTEPDFAPFKSTADNMVNWIAFTLIFLDLISIFVFKGSIISEFLWKIIQLIIFYFSGVIESA